MRLLLYKNRPEKIRGFKIAMILVLVGFLGLPAVLNAGVNQFPDFKSKLEHLVFDSSSGVPDVKSLVPSGAGPEVTQRLTAYLSRLSKFKSGLADGQYEMAYVVEMKRQVERTIVALFDTEGIEKKAKDYAENAVIYYEWEGGAEGPMDEAGYAARYLKDNPSVVFAPYLHLFCAQRYRCAFESAKRMDDTKLAEDASQKYFLYLDMALRADDVLIRWIASDIENSANYTDPDGPRPSRKTAPTGSVPQDINSIRERYRQINRSIENKELYHDRLVVNEAGDGYPAVGTYQKIYDFYYRIEEGTKLKLAKAHVHIQRAAVETYYEYLFDEAELLVFAYKKLYGDPVDEERFYFSSGVLMSYVKSGSEMKASDDGAKMAAGPYVKCARELLDFFHRFDVLPEPM